MGCGETADPVNVWFGMKTQMGPKNQMLGWGPVPPNYFDLLLLLHSIYLSLYVSRLFVTLCVV